jgi:hypothetical protein
MQKNNKSSECKSCHLIPSNIIKFDHVENKMLNDFINFHEVYSILISSLSQNYDINKPNLYLDSKCHSCVILGHQNLLDIHNKYNIIYSKIPIGNYPYLEINNKKYEYIELNRKLYENIDVKDVSEESLLNMCTNNHINCTEKSWCPKLNFMCIL